MSCVDGKICGVRVYGNINKADIANFKRFTDGLEEVRNALVAMFDEETASMAMKSIMRDTNVRIIDGEQQNTEELERLYREGAIRKSRTHLDEDAESLLQISDALHRLNG